MADVDLRSPLEEELSRTFERGPEVRTDGGRRPSGDDSAEPEAGSMATVDREPPDGADPNRVHRRGP